jgi:putative tryptophan/tyrosine transport system substrate-binding protein
MKRREFIALLGGTAALVWPFAAVAQHAMPVIGFLHPTSPDAFPDRLREFRQGLKEAGYVEGENVIIVYRFAENQSDRLSAMAGDLASWRRSGWNSCVSSFRERRAWPCSSIRPTLRRRRPR